MATPQLTPFIEVGTHTLKEARYVTSDAQQLPLGLLTIEILQGDAWILGGGHNFVVHGGDTFSILVEDEPVHIHRLYRRNTLVRYTIDHN